MSTSAVPPCLGTPLPGTPEIVRQALAACEYETRRLEVAIAEVQDRIRSARAARASLPSLGRMLSEAHDGVLAMERVYGDAARRLRRDADAEAGAVVASVAGRS